MILIGLAFLVVLGVGLMGFFGWLIERVIRTLRPPPRGPSRPPTPALPPPPPGWPPRAYEPFRQMAARRRSSHPDPR